MLGSDCLVCTPLFYAAFLHITCHLVYLAPLSSLRHLLLYLFGDGFRARTHHPLLRCLCCRDRAVTVHHRYFHLPAPAARVPTTALCRTCVQHAIPYVRRWDPTPPATHALLYLPPLGFGSFYACRLYLYAAHRCWFPRTPAAQRTRLILPALLYHACHRFHHHHIDFTPLLPYASLPVSVPPLFFYLPTVHTPVG